MTGKLDLPTAAEDAHEITIRLREAMKGEVVNYLMIGACLFLIHKEKKYRSLGFESMNDYMKDNGIAPTTGYRYEAVYRKFSDHLEQIMEKPIPHRRLIEIAYAMKRIDKREIPRLINLAHDEQSFEAFTDEIRKAKGDQTRLECDHKNQEVWARCTTCGKFLKVGGVQ